jgi:adenylyl-sulfate kinase
MVVLWLNGLSGAGKSTIADALVKSLRGQDLNCVRLDGDDLRSGLNRDLGFSAADRRENLRRAAHVARLMCNVGHTVVCSFITPLEEDRRLVGEILGNRYLEVYVRASLEACEKRDPKGLYVKARNGEINDFTGIGSPYEAPTHPHLTIDSEVTEISDAVETLTQLIRRNRLPKIRD